MVARANLPILEEVVFLEILNEKKKNEDNKPGVPNLQAADGYRSMAC